MTTDQTDGANQRVAPFTLLAQYLKDLSFENPGAPQILVSRGEVPRGQLNLDVRAKVIAPMQYEVSLLLGITAMREQETIYIIEMEYAGLFDLTGAPEEHITPLIMIEAPRMLFPFARETLAKVTREGGYPPVLLNPIDFVAVFRDQLKRQAAAAEKPVANA
jgi:preprotein translocase subunit SecB